MTTSNMTEDEKEIVVKLATDIMLQVQKASKKNVRKSLVLAAMAAAAVMVEHITEWPE